MWSAWSRFDSRATPAVSPCDHRWVRLWGRALLGLFPYVAVVKGTGNRLPSVTKERDRATSVVEEREHVQIRKLPARLDLVAPEGGEPAVLKVRTTTGSSQSRRWPRPDGRAS